jgi:segregation and condensation protein B
METDRASRKAALEAILFSHGEPMTAAALARAIKSSEEEINLCMQELRRDLDDAPSSGLCIAERGAEYQLVSKPGYFAFIEPLLQEEFAADLTPAALETLTIVLYRGPLPRAEIDYIRGVNSTHSLRNLLLRGLVDRIQDGTGRHLFRYQPSFDLLRFLGVQSVAGLPNYEELRKRSEEVETANEKQNVQEGPGVSPDPV